MVESIALDTSEAEHHGRASHEGKGRIGETERNRRGKPEEHRDAQGKRSRGKLRHSINNSTNLNLLTYDPEAETTGGHCNSISLAYLKKITQIHNFVFPPKLFIVY